MGRLAVKAKVGKVRLLEGGGTALKGGEEEEEVYVVHEPKQISVKGDRPNTYRRFGATIN